MDIVQRRRRIRFFFLFLIQINGYFHTLPIKALLKQICWPLHKFLLNHCQRHYHKGDMYGAFSERLLILLNKKRKEYTQEKQPARTKQTLRRMRPTNQQPTKREPMHSPIKNRLQKSSQDLSTQTSSLLCHHVKNSVFRSYNES